MKTQTFDKKVLEMFNRATQVVSIVSTKGGVGKTTLAANMSALLADFGFRVLMIDADVQPSLSKYYPLSYTAPNGIVELMLGENNDNNIRSCISHTVYPNLDIVLSNNISGEIQTKIQVRPDRAVLLKSKLIHPIIRSYDFVIIDTQGAVGALQDAAAFAADLLLSPVMPETLSAREFLSGTNEMLNRLSYGEAIGLRVPPLFALIYNQDRTRDSKEITAEIRNYFNQFVDGKQRLLNTIIPRAKAYKEAASLRLPVHCHDRYQTNRSECAYDIMHHLVYEIWSAMGERKLEASCFDGGADLLPVDDLSGLPEQNQQENQDNNINNNAENGSGCLNENLAPSHHSSPKHSGSLPTIKLSDDVEDVLNDKALADALFTRLENQPVNFNRLNYPACLYRGNLSYKQVQVAMSLIIDEHLHKPNTQKVQALLDEMLDLSVDSPFEHFVGLCQAANEKGEE